MFDMEQELKKWRAQLLTGGIYSASDVEELEAHVLDAVDDLMSRGLTQEESFWVAIHRIGDVESLNMEFGKVNRDSVIYELPQPEKGETKTRTKRSRADGRKIKTAFVMLLNRKWIAVSVFLLVTAAAVFYTRIIPPEYEAMAVLISRENVMPTTSSPKMVRPVRLAGIKRLMMTGDFTTSVAKKLAKSGINCHVDEVRECVRLNSPERTEIIEVIATSSDPKKASALANAAAEALIEKTAGIRNADTDRALEFLRNQLKLVDKNLRDAEVRLNVFKEQEGMFPNAGGERSSPLTQLEGLQEQLAWVQSEKELTQMQLDSVNALITEKKNQLALRKEIGYLSGSVTPQIRQLQEKISSWKLELVALQDTFTNKHYKVVELKHKIENAQTRLQEEIADLIREKSVGIDSISEWRGLVNQTVQLTVKMNGLEHREKLAAKKLEEFKKENPDLLDKEIQLVRLEREARIREKTYMLLADRREEMSLLKHVNPQEFRLVDSASPPEYPITRKREKIIVLGALLGVILGFGAAFSVEGLSTRRRARKS